jgi:hypothetical protein
MKDTKLHIVGLEALDEQVGKLKSGTNAGDDEPWQLLLCCMGGCGLLS